jgi:DNA-binding response OmpR family regulator
MRAAGSRTMRDAALDMVSEGITSIDEVNRVLAEETTAASTSGEPASPPRTTNGARILVIDDDRMIRLLVKLLLEKQGYEVIEAKNGREALDLVAREAPDMLILDLMMPEVDGYGTLQALASMTLRHPVVTIVLTSAHDQGIEAKVFDLGADDYLQKPFEPDVLLARVRGAFRRSERAVA